MTASGSEKKVPAARWVVAGFHIITVVLLLLHWYVRTLPPTTEPIPPPNSAEAVWWGLWPITYLPAPFFWAGFVIVLGLIEWTYLPTAWAANLPRLRPAWLILPSLLLVVAFFVFPIVHTRWGDAYILSRTIAWPDPTVRLTHSWQAPLDVFLHSRVWLALHGTFGWEDAVPVYRLLSPLAGAIYLGAVIGLCRDTKSMPLWLVYLLPVSLGVIQLFFGYVENYSFAAAGIILFLWLGQRALQGKTPLWVTALVLALTNATHPSTIVLAPALLYVGWVLVRTVEVAPVDGDPTMNNWSDGTRAPSAGVLSVIAAITVPMIAVAGGTLWLMEAGDHGLTALLTSDRPGGGDASWFVPLWATHTRWEAYTMLSWPHLRDLLNQQALVAPIVLPSLLWLALWRWFDRPARSVGRTEFEPAVRRFWQIAAIGHLLLIVVWNPDYGGQRDWDLFSLAAIATTLWLIGELRRADPGARWVTRAFAPLVALQVWHTAAWIYQNTLPWSWP